MTLNGNTYTNNTYEEARKLRLEENKKRFQDLGIANISKSLGDLTNSGKKSQRQHIPKRRARSAFEGEPRRSTRSRNPIKSYSDQMEIDVSLPRKRVRLNSSSWASYLARPLEEVKLASYDQRASAFKAAEELQRSLESGNPSFVKSMLRSHVYSCFWLGLPSKFCEDHLPKSMVGMLLEDEDGNEFDAIYIAKRSGLSGGWRGFALDHKLDDGDAIVFELVNPTRFKVHIVRVSTLQSEECDTDVAMKEEKTSAEKQSQAREKIEFKQKKKLAASSRKADIQTCKKDGLTKEEDESVHGDEAKSTRRSKRLATGSS